MKSHTTNKKIFKMRKRLSKKDGEILKWTDKFIRRYRKDLEALAKK